MSSSGVFRFCRLVGMPASMFGSRPPPTGVATREPDRLEPRRSGPGRSVAQELDLQSLE
jgi:hypothetical protein